MPSPRIIKVNTCSFEGEFDWGWSRFMRDTAPHLAYDRNTLDYDSAHQLDGLETRLDELMESYSGSKPDTTLINFNSMRLPLYLSALNSIKCCGTHNDKSVFTAHHADLYTVAPPVYVASDSLIWSFQKDSPDFSYRTFFGNLSKMKYGSNYRDFKIESNTGFENLLLESTVTQELENNEYLQCIENVTINAWIPKSFTSGSSALEFNYKSVTQAKLKRSLGAVVPILVPITIKNTADGVATKEDAYFYTFLINAKINKINKYKRARQYFLLYINRFISYSGLYYANKNEYENIIYRNPYMRFLSHEHLPIYTSIYNQSVSKTFESRATDPLSLDQLSPVIAEKVFPEKYLSEKTKLDKKIQLLEQASFASISDPLTTIRADVTHSLSLSQDRKYKKERIDNMIKRLWEERDSLNQVDAKIHEHRLTVGSKIQELHKVLASTHSYLKAKLHFIGRQKSLNLTFFNLLKSTPLEIPQTERNLLKDFSIHSMTLHFGEASQSFILNATTSKDDLTAAMAKGDPTIQELVFLTKSPSRIRIDGKDAGARVGGPYLVKVTPQSLNLQLAQPNSYIGIDGVSLIYHPHVSSRGSLTESTTACLGEASPLIYTAFQSNRVSRIILAVNTWLTSANSADHWGKRYIHFPYWSDYETYSEWQATTASDTHIEEDPQQETTQPIQQEQAEPLQVEDTVQYTRYTPR